MRTVSEWVLRHRKLVMLIALLLCLASLYGMQHVHINYDMTDYLPADAPSARALKLLGDGVPNLQVYVPGVSPRGALHAKEQLLALPDVSEVLWLDDVVDLRDLPFESLLASQVAPYYAQGGPRFQVTVNKDRFTEGFEAIQQLFPDAVFKGEAVNQARLQTVSMGEVSSIMVYVLPLALLILLLSTDHWAEPLLFLIAIGVAILLNEGTNLLFGSVSFVTQACSAVLQLAVSIDYAVFLLHRFGEYRREGLDAPQAMQLAMQKAASSIAASAMTTVSGFLALLVMRFGMGQDMGLVLAKGVVFSYLSVMIVLPAVAVAANKWIDRSAHRPLMPSFRRFGRAVVRYSAPLAIVAILLLLPSFLGQRKNAFIYGSAGMHAGGSPVRQQAEKMDEMFGQGQTMLLLVPQGERAKLAAFTEQIKDTPGIASVISYAQAVGAQIPQQMVPWRALEQLRHTHYERIVLIANVEEEGERAFRLVRELRDMARTAYGQDTHLLGEPVVNEDLRASITADNVMVLVAGLLAIGSILILTFRNLTIPLILLLVIEGSIWINMAVPYFMGASMNYIGYQIVSSVQLGATVDYGILLAQRYIEGRTTRYPKEAAAWALSKSTGSILPPMMILVIAGYAMLVAVRSNGVISQMGEVVGRGAAVSGLMVLLVLPKVLQWCDPLIRRTNLSRAKE